MGKTIYAEEDVIKYLKNVSNPDVCSTGLILGQSTNSTDYVVLLVRTPEQSSKVTEDTPVLGATFPTVKQIQELWIADHAKHVTKMLPGGMWVLGAFICSSNDLFSDSSAQSKAKSLLYLMKKHLSTDPLFHANSPFAEKLLLHFNTVDSTYSCKTLDTSKMGSAFKDADWKFKNNYTKWCQIYCNFDLSLPSYGGNMSCPVKEQLKNALNEVNKNLEKAMVILNDQGKNSNESLESVIRKSNLQDLQKDEIPCLKANIFLPLKKVEENEGEVMIKDCDVELHLVGVLASNVFLSQKSTVAEAISALKQDVIRSLAARFEMHWDLLMVEEYGSPEEKLSVHEPPRRVSVMLPDSKIAFSDYLFPGEGASEVILFCKEMLDISISESNLNKEIEMQGDPMEFYGKSSISLPTTSSDELLGSPLPKGFLLLLISAVVILIAIAIALFIQRGNSVSANK